MFITQVHRNAAIERSVATITIHIAVIKKVRIAHSPMPYALCPMPYALCPMPYALCPMPYALCRSRTSYESSKGYSLAAFEAASRKAQVYKRPTMLKRNSIE